MAKIVIHMVGGNVDYVCSDDPNITVVLHDSDNLQGDGVGAEERTSIFDKASMGCKQVTIVDSRELTGSGVTA